MPTVIILGSGISGLFSAAVYCKKKYEVVLIDKDHTTDRPAIPQRHHVHCCMTYCSTWIDAQFPNFWTHFEKLGGHKLYWGTDVYNKTNGHVSADFKDGDLYSYFSSRNVIEQGIRLSLVEKYECTMIQERVKDLIWAQRAGSDPNRVIGCTTSERDRFADLVVDCRGANVKDFPHLPDKKSDAMNVPVHYYTATCGRRPDILFPYRAYMARRTGNDIFYIHPIENDRWMITLGGTVVVEDPIEHLRSIPEYYDEYQILSSITDLSDWKHGYACKWWFNQRPSVNGYIELGDRNCRVIPIYGTGMTMCAKQAEMLAHDPTSEQISTYLKKIWIKYQSMYLQRARYRGIIIKPTTWVKRTTYCIVQSNLQYCSSASNLIMGVANYMDDYDIRLSQQSVRILVSSVFHWLRNIWTRPRYPRRAFLSYFEVDRSIRPQKLPNGIAFLRPFRGPRHTIVYLHGFPENAYCWMNYLEQDDGVDRIAFFLRGYFPSFSPIGAQYYQHQHLVNDIIESLHLLGVQQFSLVGHNWGGTLAYLIADDLEQRGQSGRVHSMTIQNAPHPKLLWEQMTMQQACMSWYALVFKIPVVGRYVAQYFVSRLGRTTPAYNMNLMNVDQITAYFQNVWNIGDTYLTHKSRIPITVIYNQSDPYLSQAVCTTGIGQYFSNATIRLVPEAGHYVKTIAKSGPEPA